MTTNVGGPEHVRHVQIASAMDGEVACDCGVTFYADEAEPTCDICGHTMESEPEVEWNGDTGNHVPCEERVQERLEYLRGEIRAEQISMSEIAELQGLADFIKPGDVELLEWAGVPEFPEDESVNG